VRRPRGFTLIEMIISLAIAGILLTAAYRLLVANQRFYRSQSVVHDIQSNVREAALILSSELREVSASGGDLQLMSDTSITINAMRVLGFVCAPPDMLLGRVVVRNSALFKYRNIDATRDSVFIFREGLTNRTSDDRWLRGRVNGTAAALCSDGTAGTRIGMASLLGTGNFLQLDSVTQGSPVRAFETVNYRLYSSGGTWWLGVSNLVSGSWTAVSAVAGPMRANDGVWFTYLDSTGAVTATATNVRAIQVNVRGQSTQAISIPGHPSGTYSDSLSIRVAVRNN